MIEAFMVMLFIGGILGAILGLASKVFAVKEDERIVICTKMLPGYNCGACGCPGCSGLAEALVCGKQVSVRVCKPAKQEQREKIADYLNNAENPTGIKLHITA